MFFSGHRRLWLEWPPFDATQATQACTYLHHQHNLVPQVLAKQIQLDYSVITSASAFGACFHTHLDISWSGCSPWIARSNVRADSGKPDTIIGPNLKIRLNLSRFKYGTVVECLINLLSTLAPSSGLHAQTPNTVGWILGMRICRAVGTWYLELPPLTKLLNFI